MNENEVTEVATVSIEVTDPEIVHKATKCKTSFFLGAGLFLIVLYSVSNHAVRWHPFGIGLCTWILAIPILMNGIYHASIRRVLFLTGLSRRGHIYRYCSGYVLRLILHTFLGLCAAIVIIMEVVYSPRPHVQLWSIFALSSLLIYPVYRRIHRIVLREAPAWHAGRISMTISSSLVAILAAILFAISTNFGTDYPIFESVSSAIASQPRFLVNDQPIGLLLDYYSQARGAAEYAFGLLRSSEIGYVTYVIFYSIMVFLFFLGVTSAISTFCLPLRELWRSLSSTTAPSPSVSLAMRVLALAIVIAVSVAYFYGFWNLTREVESIRGELVRLGTVDDIELTKARYESLLREHLSEVSAVKWTHIESSVDDMTAEMKSNVDDFLEWYYGPGGELMRTATRVSRFMSRDGAKYEQEMIDKLHEYLIDGVPSAPLEEAIDEYHELVDTLIQVTTEQYNTSLEQIISTNAIDTSTPGPVTVVAYNDSTIFGLADELRKSLRLRNEAFRQRQNASVISGALGGAVAATLVGKAVYKRGVGNASRLIQRLPRAARPIARTILLGSRVISISSGVGLVAMVALTVGSEYVILKFHEQKDRPQFRESIFDAIDTSQRVLKAELQRLVQP